MFTIFKWQKIPFCIGRIRGQHGHIINQNQYRTGTHSISAADVAAINDAGGSQEVEKQTINRYITLGLNYIPTPDWNLSLFLPYISRSHTTYGEATNPLTPDLISGASDGRIHLISPVSGSGVTPERSTLS